VTSSITPPFIHGNDKAVAHGSSAGQGQRRTRVLKATVQGP
jgi:hypothetical protein